MAPLRLSWMHLRPAPTPLRPTSIASLSSSQRSVLDLKNILLGDVGVLGSWVNPLKCQVRACHVVFDSIRLHAALVAIWLARIKTENVRKQLWCFLRSARNHERQTLSISTAVQKAGSTGAFCSQGSPASMSLVANSSHPVLVGPPSFRLNVHTHGNYPEARGAACSVLACPREEIGNRGDASPGSRKLRCRCPFR